MAVWFDFKIKNYSIQKWNYMWFDFILDDSLKKYIIAIGTKSSSIPYATSPLDKEIWWHGN
jgi:aminopeptidase-like protein